MTDDLLTTPQVSHLLGVSTRTIHRRVEDGEMVPAQKLPGPTGALLFRRSDIQHLIDAARKAAYQRAVDLGVITDAEQPTGRAS